MNKLKHDNRFRLDSEQDGSAYLSGLLIVWPNKNVFHAREAKRRGARIAQFFLVPANWMRYVSRISKKLYQSLLPLMTCSWIRQLGSCHTIILHASPLAPDLVQLVRKHSTSIRIIIWYWNPVDKTVSVHRFDGLSCELWSFDENDCQHYGLNYNTQYHFKNMDNKSGLIRQDVLFVGKDKGRMKDLMGLKFQFTSLGLSCNFHITPDKDKCSGYESEYRKPIAYMTIIDQILQSHAILDYVSENQSGLTLRPLEALFLKRKLITNDMSMVTRDFYHPANIFIIGKDEYSRMREFIESPYQELSDSLIDRYDFANWVLRFT